MPTIAEKRRAFRTLHARGCFVIPNPWDIGTARYLQHMGFKALATTSAGFAWARGVGDGAVPRDVMLAHIAELAAGVDVPVNADFENGYAHEPEAVAESVALCVASGVSGLSIEDYSGDPAQGLYDFEMAVARIKAARAAIDKTGGDVLLTGRSEGFFRGRPDMPETVRRLQAFAAAGADCLYAPGIVTREQIAAVVTAVAPKPFNLLVGGPSDLSVADMAALGVRRISTGGALARAAWGGLLRSAELILREGSFKGLADAAPGAEIMRGLRRQP